MRLVVTVALGVGLATTSYAASTPEALKAQLGQEFLEYSASCGGTLPNPKTLEARYQKAQALDHYKLGTKTLPITVGSSSQPEGGGLVLFTHKPQHAYYLATSSTLTQLYASPDAKRIAAFFMLTSEGPGPMEVAIIDQTKQPAVVYCTTFEAPKAINNPYWNMEYVEPAAFNMDAKGNGTLYASADLDYGNTPTPKTIWFKYTTHNGGKSWSLPFDLKKKPNLKLLGIYQKTH